MLGGVLEPIVFGSIDMGPPGFDDATGILAVERS